MRIAAITDIHGNLGALTAVLADIRRRGCDAIVNLGDIVSGPLLPAETADTLMALDLPTIHGNHERQLLDTPIERMGKSDAYARGQLREEHVRWISELPATLALNEDVFLCHGTPRDDMQYFLEECGDDGLRAATPDEVAQRAGDCPAKVILCGHSHLPRIVRLADGRLIVNPGSVGLQAFHMEVPCRHDVETASPQARYAVIEKIGGNWQAELIGVDYDHETAAVIAQHHGRPDWAHALRTGRVPPHPEH